MDLKLKLNTKQLLRAFHLVPAQLEVELKDALDHAGRKFLKEFRRRRLQGPPGIKARSRGIFSHFHRNNVFFRGRQALDSYVEIYSDSKVAKLHEEGGTVKDPSGGKMSVPLSARKEMYTSTGALRKRYKDVRNLRNVIPKKINGKVFLVRVKKKDKSIKPLYVLKRSVKIKPKLGFYATFEAIAPELTRIFNKSFDKALDKAWKK